MAAGASVAKGAFMVELDQMKLQLTVMRVALRDKEAELATEQRRVKEMGRSGPNVLQASGVRTLESSSTQRRS